MSRPTLPRLSVVTPSFNQAPFLAECIESVLSQGYPGLEYVVMDGGSTDGSQEIIRRYEKHLTYWQSQPDGGHYAAVNAGFARTSGEVMAWLNSDDKYPQGALLRVGWLFATKPEVRWLTGRALIWNRDGLAEALETGSMRRSAADFVGGAFEDPFIQQESTFWRRSLWDEAGGRVAAELRLAGDLELWVRFFRTAPLYPVEALLGGFRQHGAQRSVEQREEYLREARQVLERERGRRDTPSLSKEAPEPLIIDTLALRDLALSHGMPTADPSGIESLLMKMTVDSTRGQGATEARKAYEMIVRLDRALTEERRRSEWLYSSSLWRIARRVRQMLQNGRAE